MNAVLTELEWRWHRWVLAHDQHEYTNSDVVTEKVRQILDKGRWSSTIETVYGPAISCSCGRLWRFK